MELTRKEFLKNAAVAAAALAAGTAFVKPARAGSGVIRPPGSVDEEEFLSRCIRCGRCADACPNQCISAFTSREGARFSMKPGRGEEGTPVIFPRQQACNLCLGATGDFLRCTEVCPTGALQKVRRAPQDIQAKVSMGKAQVDENLCFSYMGSSCGVCVRACPFEGKALRAGQGERPILNPEFCVGCGLCERSCIRYPQAILVKAAA